MLHLLFIHNFCINFPYFFNTQKYYGTLEAVGTRESIIRDIIARRNVRYKIRFPLQNPLPRVSSIIYDSKIICTGLQGMFGRFYRYFKEKETKKRHVTQIQTISLIYFSQNLAAGS